MEPNQIEHQAKIVIKTLRSISFKNLAERVGVPLDLLIPVIEVMDMKGSARIVNAKGCAGSCTSCSTCATESAPQYSGEEILISKLYDIGDDYAAD